MSPLKAMWVSGAPRHHIRRRNRAGRRRRPESAQARNRLPASRLGRARDEVPYIKSRPPRTMPTYGRRQPSGCADQSGSPASRGPGSPAAPEAPRQRLFQGDDVLGLVGRQPRSCPPPARCANIAGASRGCDSGRMAIGIGVCANRSAAGRRSAALRQSHGPVPMIDLKPAASASAARIRAMSARGRRRGCRREGWRDRRSATWRRTIRSVAPQRPSGRRRILTGWPPGLRRAPAPCARPGRRRTSAARRDRGRRVSISIGWCRHPRHGRADKWRRGGAGVFSTISARMAAWKAMMTPRHPRESSAWKRSTRTEPPRAAAAADIGTVRQDGGPGQPCGHSPRRKIVATPSGRAGARAATAAEARSEAAERRPADELGAGDEDDRAALQIAVHRRAGDPALAGVDDQGRMVAMGGDQAVDIGERGQDQAGLRAVDDMDQAVPARGAGGGDRALHPLGDVDGGAHPAHPVAHRNVDQLDMDSAEAGHGPAGRHRDAERGLVGEIVAVRRMDAARADLVGAEQDGVGAAGCLSRHAGERDIFEVGARGREAMATSSATHKRCGCARAGSPAAPHRWPARGRADLREDLPAARAYAAGERRWRSGRRRPAPATPGRAVIAVEAGGGSRARRASPPSLISLRPHFQRNAMNIERAPGRD